MIVVIPAGRSWPLRSRYEVSTIVRVVYLLSVTIHVLAAMTWVGGMLLFVVAVMPTIRRQHDPVRRAFLEDFGPRFRIVARVCLGVLVLTGIVNLWMRGVQLSDPLRPEWRDSSFGQLVVFKLSLVLLAIVVSVLHERLVSTRRARWLGRVSLLLGLTIVALAVVLVRNS